MALSKIGPQELFLYPEQLSACQLSLEQNSEASVTWFLNNTKITQQFKKACAVKNGHPADRNILMLTCQYKNWTLLKFLLDNIQDNALINIKDNHGKTALSMLFITPIGSEKEIEFAKLFISKGAKANVPLLSRTQLTQSDEDGYHYTDTLAGSLLMRLAQCTHDKKSTASLKLYETALSLLLEHHSLCKAPRIGRMSLGRIAEGDDFMVPTCIELFTPLKVNALWKKARMLFLAKNSTHSPFDQLGMNDCFRKLVSIFWNLFR